MHPNLHVKKASRTFIDHSPKPKPVIFVSASAVDFTIPGQLGWSEHPASHRMFTVFHLFILLGIGAGIALGLDGGAKLFGLAGGFAGAAVGGYTGFIAGRLPEFLVLRSLSESLALKTSDQLRSCLRGPDCQIPNVILLELQRRGEDVRGELEVVLDMLVSEDLAQRGRGWAALTSAYPQWAGRLGDYRLGDSVAECGRKTDGLRRAALEFTNHQDTKAQRENHFSGW